MTDREEGRHPRHRDGRFPEDGSLEADTALPAPVPGVLAEAELRAVQEQFGVSEQQVQRDHVISHALAAIARSGTDDVVFFGGTALSRTHLTDLRLSEDIDLIAIGERADVAERIESAVGRQLRRTLGAVSFTPPLRGTRHPDPSVMEVAGINIQVQLLSSRGYPKWSTELVDIEQRYTDAPPARMRVLTPAAFAAAKLSSWQDRNASRDLYDLWAMTEAGMVDADAAALFARFGPFTHVTDLSFDRIPSEDEWERSLGHQGRIRVGPEEAARHVRDALDRLR